jgi:hypothetical protein
MKLLFTLHFALIFSSTITAVALVTRGSCVPNSPKPPGPPQCAQFFPDLAGKFKNFQCPGPSPDDKLKNLNDLERDYCGGGCLGYTCNPIQAYQCNIVRITRGDADTEQTNFCNDFMQKNCIHNSESDAFHHCYWNARMTLDGDASLATHFGQMHECGANRTNDSNQYLTQPDIELHMDLHNNAIGRSVGEKARGMYLLTKGNPEWLRRNYCRDQCRKLATTGGLWVIDTYLEPQNFPYPDPTNPLLISW